MPDAEFEKITLTKKITLTFQRTKVIKETGSITIDLTDEADAALRDYRQLDAWAQFTAMREVKNWKAPEPIAILEWRDIKWDAEFADGTKMSRGKKP